MLNLLERLQIEKVCDTDAEAFAIDVKNKLGYKPLADKLLLSEEAATLSRIGLMPFTPESVVKYKVETAAKASTPDSTIAFGIFGCFLAIGACSLIGFFVCAILMISSIADRESVYMCLLTMFGSLVGAIMTVICTPTKEAYWHLVKIDDYDDEIPAFVLQTALDIRKDHPAAALFVDRLVVEQKTFDPFLVVQFDIDRPKHYIEVWAEPGFRQQRTV
jgi:hypothetical protein